MDTYPLEEPQKDWTPNHDQGTPNYADMDDSNQYDNLYEDQGSSQFATRRELNLYDSPSRVAAVQGNPVTSRRGKRFRRHQDLG